MIFTPLFKPLKALPSFHQEIAFPESRRQEYPEIREGTHSRGRLSHLTLKHPKLGRGVQEWGGLCTLQPLLSALPALGALAYRPGHERRLNPPPSTRACRQPSWPTAPSCNNPLHCPPQKPRCGRRGAFSPLLEVLTPRSDLPSPTTSLSKPLETSGHSHSLFLLCLDR